MHLWSFAPRYVNSAILAKMIITKYSGGSLHKLESQPWTWTRSWMKQLSSDKVSHSECRITVLVILLQYDVEVRLIILVIDVECILPPVSYAVAFKCSISSGGNIAFQFGTVVSPDGNIWCYTFPLWIHFKTKFDIDFF